MPNISYDDVGIPVRPDFAAAHNRFWERLARPGAWWTSAERIDIARESRAAWNCEACLARREALSPNTDTGEHTAVTDLPTAAIDAIHRIVTDASRLSKSWYEQKLATGLSEGQYVELVGAVVAMVSIDSFTDALGLERLELPSPGEGARATQPGWCSRFTSPRSRRCWCCAC